MRGFALLAPSFTMALPLHSKILGSPSKATKSIFVLSSRRRIVPSAKRIATREPACVQIRSPGNMGTLMAPGSGSGCVARCSVTSPSK